jgi:hypothetical protein
MLLVLDAPGAEARTVGDEIWEQPLADAIRSEAQIVADYATEQLLESCGCGSRRDFASWLTAEMLRTLRGPGDSYLAPDGVMYSLVDGVPNETTGPIPPVVQRVRFEALPVGARGSRRAIARWSDGSESEALRWYDDEILICEGDLIGKSSEQIRMVHFQRDRRWLTS